MLSYEAPLIYKILNILLVLLILNYCAMVVKAMFQNQQLDIFQSSKITINGKLEHHRLSKTFAARFDKSGYTFFENFFLPPSLTYANIPSDTSLVISYILFYLILLLLEN